MVGIVEGKRGGGEKLDPVDMVIMWMRMWMKKRKSGPGPDVGLSMQNGLRGADGNPPATWEEQAHQTIQQRTATGCMHDCPHANCTYIVINDTQLIFQPAYLFSSHGRPCQGRFYSSNHH